MKRGKVLYQELMTALFVLVRISIRDLVEYFCACF